MAFDGITIDLGSIDHIEGAPGEAKFLPGPQGPQGETGATGPTGVSVTDVSVERTSGTGDAGTTDTYTGTVTFSDSTTTTFVFDVYNGEDGTNGQDGAAATIAVGNVTSGADASVTNSGTSSAAVFDFVLQKGDKGDTGDTGDTGAAATITVGSVSSGETASVTNSGTSSAAVFDFVLPKGDKGDTGNTGATGETGATGTSVTGVTVARTSGTGAPGTTDTYTGTVAFSNSTTSTFTFSVYNGADGQGSGDMLKSVYDTDNDGVVDNAEQLGGHAASYFQPLLTAGAGISIVDGVISVTYGVAAGVSF